jgi:hypothetical protein
MFGERPRKPPECLVATVKHGSGTVIIWAAISWYSAGPIITLHGRTTASDYVDILGNQMHPVVQMLFPNNDANFKMTIRPNTHAAVFSLGFVSMKMHFFIFPSQQTRQT